MLSVPIFLVEGLELGVPVEKHPALEPPRQSLGALVVDELGSWGPEDVVELLERALLGLGYPEEDHYEGEHIETGVEPKDTNNLEPVEQEGEGNA